jgi:hypothetical protein
MNQRDTLIQIYYHPALSKVKRWINQIGTAGNTGVLSGSEIGILEAPNNNRLY